MPKKVVNAPVIAPETKQLVVQPVTVVELTVDQKLDALKVRMQTAAAAGDLDSIIAIGKEADSLKKYTAKAENEKILARAEELKGAREQFSGELGVVVHEALAVVFPDLNTTLLALDATGLQIKYTIESNSWEIGGTYRSATPVKGVRSTGTGRTGKTSAEFGKTLNDVFEEFADQVGDITTNKETGSPRLLMVHARENDSPNGAKEYLVKKAVKVAAIAKGLLKA